MKKLMIIMSATLLLSSCGLYNKYERPEVNTTGLIRDVASDIDTLAVQDTASFGNLPWRQVFTDPQLQALIEQGLEKNADLQNAALTVEMYETMLKAAKLAFLPAVQFGSNNGMGTISTLHTDPSVTTKAYTLPVSASWTILSFTTLTSTRPALLSTASRTVPARPPETVAVSVTSSVSAVVAGSVP
jgi:outer membrane protein TolC